MALFGLGCIAALFGPIKYGILPDHLRREELVAANALVEGATFAAIICGLIVGGLAASEGRSATSVVAQLMVIALACYGAARLIPPTGVGAPGLKVHRNVIASTWRIIGEVRADDRQWVAALATSWFWTVGIVALSLVPVIIKSRNRRRDRRRNRDQSHFRSRDRRRIARRRRAVARTHRACACAFPSARHGAALAIDLGLATNAMPRASREVPLIEFFMSATRPARRPRAVPLFRRRGPVRRADLRRDPGMGGGGSARAQSSARSMR